MFSALLRLVPCPRAVCRRKLQLRRWMPALPCRPVWRHRWPRVCHVHGTLYCGVRMPLWFILAHRFHLRSWYLQPRILSLLHKLPCGYLRVCVRALQCGVQWLLLCGLHLRCGVHVGFLGAVPRRVVLPCRCGRLHGLSTWYLWSRRRGHHRRLQRSLRCGSVRRQHQPDRLHLRRSLPCGVHVRCWVHG